MEALKGVTVEEQNSLASQAYNDRDKETFELLKRAGFDPNEYYLKALNPNLYASRDFIDKLEELAGFDTAVALARSSDDISLLLNLANRAVETCNPEMLKAVAGATGERVTFAQAYFQAYSHGNDPLLQAFERSGIDINLAGVDFKSIVTCQDPQEKKERIDQIVDRALDMSNSLSITSRSSALSILESSNLYDTAKLYIEICESGDQEKVAMVHSLGFSMANAITLSAAKGKTDNLDRLRNLALSNHDSTAIGTLITHASMDFSSYFSVAYHEGDGKMVTCLKDAGFESREIEERALKVRIALADGDQKSLQDLAMEAVQENDFGAVKALHQRGGVSFADSFLECYLSSHHASPQNKRQINRFRYAGITIETTLSSLNDKQRSQLLSAAIKRGESEPIRLLAPTQMETIAREFLGATQRKDNEALATMSKAGVTSDKVFKYAERNAPPLYLLLASATLPIQQGAPNRNPGGLEKALNRSKLSKEYALFYAYSYRDENLKTFLSNKGMTLNTFIETLPKNRALAKAFIRDSLAKGDIETLSQLVKQGVKLNTYEDQDFKIVDTLIDYTPAEQLEEITRLLLSQPSIDLGDLKAPKGDMETTYFNLLKKRGSKLKVDGSGRELIIHLSPQLLEIVPEKVLEALGDNCKDFSELRVAMYDGTGEREGAIDAGGVGRGFVTSFMDALVQESDQPGRALQFKRDKGAFAPVAPKEGLSTEAQKRLQTLGAFLAGLENKNRDKVAGTLYPTGVKFREETFKATLSFTPQESALPFNQLSSERKIELYLLTLNEEEAKGLGNQVRFLSMTKEQFASLSKLELNDALAISGIEWEDHCPEGLETDNFESIIANFEAIKKEIAVAIEQTRSDDIQQTLEPLHMMARGMNTRAGFDQSSIDPRTFTENLQGISVSKEALLGHLSFGTLAESDNRRAWLAQWIEEAAASGSNFYLQWMEENSFGDNPVLKKLLSDENPLRLFVEMITGSSSLADDEVKIFGIPPGQHAHFHTCYNRLDIPGGSKDYREFKSMLIQSLANAAAARYAAE